MNASARARIDSGASSPAGKRRVYERRHRRGQRSGQQRLEDLLVAGEVRIDAGLGEPRAPRDILDPRRREPVLRKLDQRGIENSLRADFGLQADPLAGGRLCGLLHWDDGSLERRCTSVGRESQHRTSRVTIANGTDPSLMDRRSLAARPTCESLPGSAGEAVGHLRQSIPETPNREPPSTRDGESEM